MIYPPLRNMKRRAVGKSSESGKQIEDLPFDKEKNIVAGIEIEEKIKKLDNQLERLKNKLQQVRCVLW